MNVILPCILQDNPEHDNQLFRLFAYNTQKLEIHHILYGIGLVKATAIPTDRRYHHINQLAKHQSILSKWPFTKHFPKKSYLTIRTEGLREYLLFVLVRNQVLVQRPLSLHRFVSL
jgi:hypothetical protein